MTTKHTPGPWKRDKYGHVVDSGGNEVRFRQVTTLMSGSDESMRTADDNTNLLVAAPDLLEALKSCYDLGIDLHLVPMVKAAIAKATGEHQ